MIDLGHVQRLRIAVAALAAGAILAVGAVVAFAAPGSVGRAASPSGGAARAVYCPPREKARRKAALAKFRKGMVAARRRYFRTHPRASDRARFVKAQNAQLKALQRKLAQCT
jgi:hypothetical protein